MINVDRLSANLLIHATNVHSGGGRTLLQAILSLPLNPGTTALLDTRMPLPEGMPTSTRVVRAKPSIWGRLKAERFLAATAQSKDTVLCFGNLPPLFNLAAHVVVFLQNRHLIENTPLGGFSIEEKLRLRLERIWFKMRAGSVDKFVVQTPSMKRALERHLLGIKTKPRLHIEIKPFMNGGMQSPNAQPDILPHKSVIYDFIYVASGEPHKNHRRLIDAWALLADDGFRPSLALTIDQAKFPDLCAWIESQKRIYGLRIDNKGLLKSPDVRYLYECSGALVFPSLLESFGLPLIEAKNAGLPVLAGELDYVRDVLHPAETFDPRSAVSISRAIKRFRHIEEPPLKIVDASVFIKCLHSD